MKKIFSVLVILGLIVQFCLYPGIDCYAMTEYNATVREYSEQATKYVKGKKDSIHEVIFSCAEELGIEQDDLDNFYLGSPFVIYNLDIETQEEIYNYPLINKKTQKVFLIVSVIGTTEGWQYTISKELVDDLNKIKWSDKNCIFYESEGNLVAQTKEKKYSFSREKVRDGFDKKTFVEKQKEIVDNLGKMKKINVSKRLSQSENLIERYSPTITSELGYYYCNLNNAQGQYGRQMCWAASVATIVNYIKGTNYTAWNVCDAMGKGYDAGGDIYDKKKALAYYGINYVEKLGQSAFSSIISDINAKRPIGMSTTSAMGGHAVTLYGYRNLANGKYIMIWDSNLNSGEGDLLITSYKSTGTTFSYSSVSFTWINSVVNNAISYK